MNHHDIFGQAFHDYMKGIRDEQIEVQCDACDSEDIPVSYFFRSEFEMPIIEHKALSICRGKVLDIGAGSGIHSKWLQDKGIETIALESSKGAVEVMQKIGVNQTILCDLYEYDGKGFDTVLLLMNNTGIAGTIENLPSFLLKCLSFLKSDGQILLTSADISYAYMDENGNMELNWDVKYHGEVTFTLHYKDFVGAPFPWLFLDYFRLSNLCQKLNLKCEKIADGEHFDYLARISRT